MRSRRKSFASSRFHAIWHIKNNNDDRFMRAETFTFVVVVDGFEIWFRHPDVSVPV